MREPCWHDGVGITPADLAVGTAVMVPMGALSSVVNGHACLIAWAVVQGPADDKPATDPDAKWWLHVYAVPDGEPLPQMYRARDILGIPALGLSMAGAPPQRP